MKCTIQGCDEPRHVTKTGSTEPMMCDAHDRMMRVLQGGLRNGTGSSVGTWAIFRLMEADSDHALEILKRELQARAGTYDAEDLFDRMEGARLGLRQRLKPRRLP